MTISNEITRINTNIENAYSACDSKGATMPATQNSANLATCIGSIQQGANPVISSLNVTPTTSAQTISAPSGTDGYSPVNVSAVTSAIDNNITASNIKSGVSILGVSGSLTELKGETKSESLTNKNGQTFTPSSGKNGITSITVTPNNQARTVTPTTYQQSLTVNSGYSGNGTITVNAVTSNIDANITAGNIKKYVTILGVTGTYEGSGVGSDKIVDGTIVASDYSDDKYYLPNLEDLYSSITLKLVFNASDYLSHAYFFNSSDGSTNDIVDNNGTDAIVGVFNDFSSRRFSDGTASFHILEPESGDIENFDVEWSTS